MLSDLYTNIMEKVMPVLQENWQLFLLGVGVLFILGAVFNWKWTWDQNGHRSFGFNAWVYRNFGEKGARINTAVIGATIAICAIILWVLM